MTATIIAPDIRHSRSDTAVAAKPRRRIGVLIPTVVALVVAAGALSVAAGLAMDPVKEELRAQRITFPPAAALEAEGRGDLASYGGQLVDTGTEAKAFAGYISGHLEDIGGGQTYAELGVPERAAFAEVEEAIAAGAPQSRIDELRGAHAPLKAQRNAVFEGQMLRGSLLSAYGWWTVGQTALYAAWGLLALAVIIGVGGFVRRTLRR